MGVRSPIYSSPCLLAHLGASICSSVFDSYLVCLSSVSMPDRRSSSGLPLQLTVFVHCLLALSDGLIDDVAGPPAEYSLVVVVVRLEDAPALLGAEPLHADGLRDGIAGAGLRVDDLAGKHVEQAGLRGLSHRLAVVVHGRLEYPLVDVEAVGLQRSDEVLLLVGERHGVLDHGSDSVDGRASGRSLG
ncbi:hypothetical protein PRIPAC_84169 [Pristionchus pacificus]|uniref:Uncharacterized protein n=1 Tax=Pristionchus pacificus TaxID=54126 RepID=A0A8R1YU51_PRIPA|nr:hypothetical protein PRIPAC_84169 [Pristionchus pacificus]|eukprot:PDM68683.1 hypothetical protein PRIPAC_46985 [Pristionchus pacificus]